MADKPQAPKIAPVFGFNKAAAQGETVTIFIGPTKKRYIIYKDIICHHSEYFRAAYNGRWKESEEGVTLEDVEVGVFNVFVHWLYTQQLPQGDEESNRIADEDEEEGSGNEYHDYDLRLLKLCTFGNRFLVPDFERIAHNHYIDHLVKCNSGVMYEQIIFAWGNFRGDNVILDVMAENQCLRWSVSGDDEEEQELRLDLPKGFLIRMMLKFAELRGEGNEPERLKGEDYYMQEKVKEVGK